MEYKIQKVEIRNFKGIEDLTLDLNGKHLILIGDNELGKSSALDAIWSTLSNKGIPQQPIRDGAEKSDIVIVIGTDENKYRIEKKYTKKGAYLEIESPDGFSSSKISNLTHLVGDVGFDIFEFVELSRTVPGRRQQVNIIKEFIDPGLLERIEKNNEKIGEIKESRKILNARLIELNGLLKTSEFDENDLETYKETKSTAEIQGKIEDGVVHNREYTNYSNEVTGKPDSSAEEIIRSLDNRLKGIKLDSENELVRLKAAYERAVKNETAKRDQMIDGIEFSKQKVKDFKIVDVTSLRDQLNKVEEHNRKVLEIRSYKNNLHEQSEKKQKYNIQGDHIAKSEEDNRKALSEAKVPVEGLTFDEEMLYLGGLPFTEEQISTSQLIETGVQLAIAKDPRVKIIRINRGESIGEKKMRELIATCKKHGYQMFIERMVTGEEKLKLVYFEEADEILK